MEKWGICEQGWRKGPWTTQEDKLLVQYISQNGEGRWSSVSKCTGLKRSGKSCRLRWVNYLRPGLKKGQLTPQEQRIIIELHSIWGNKWSTIARYLPGRTDNEIKNYWRTHFKKRSSPSKPCSHKIKKRRTHLIEEKQETANYEESNVDIESPQSAAAENVNDNYKHETGFDYQRVVVEEINNNDQMLPMFYRDYYHSLSCSDHFMSSTIPMDYCYLWDGLWNFDDDRTSHLN